MEKKSCFNFTVLCRHHHTLPLLLFLSLFPLFRFPDDQVFKVGIKELLHDHRPNKKPYYCTNPLAGLR